MNDDGSDFGDDDRDDDDDNYDDDDESDDDDDVGSTPLILQFNLHAFFIPIPWPS